MYSTKVNNQSVGSSFLLLLTNGALYWNPIKKTTDKNTITNLMTYATHFSPLLET